MNLKVRQRNVLEDVKTYPDCNFDTVMSDPPYNLNSKWKICPDTGKYIMTKSSDFMNKWEGLNHDDLELMFREFYRVLKHGGFCVMFGLSRQMQPFYYYALKAGFIQLENMYWCQISNFPKAVDVSIALDKKLGNSREPIGIKPNSHDIRGNALMERNDSEKMKENPYIDIVKTKSTSEIGQMFEGYKYSQAPLKKVFEPIMIFVKPPKESVIGDIIQGDKDTTPSCLNIDAGRVPMDDSEKFQNVQGKRDTASVLNDKQSGLNKEGLIIESHPLGRFPPNVFIDKGMEEYLGPDVSKILHTCEDSEVFYEPVVGQAERNAGLDGFSEQVNQSLSVNVDGTLNKRTCGQPTSVKNPHPSLKPISLIYRIAKLFLLPPKYNQHMYIPFCGTFSEIIGAVKAGIPNITGCEMNPEYIKIGVARLKYWKDVKIKEEKKEAEAERKPVGKNLW